MENPNHVLGFNNPAELLEIEAYYQEKKRAQSAPELPEGDAYRPVSRWLAAIEGLGQGLLEREPELAAEWRATYGDDAALLAERRAAYQALLRHAAEVLGQDVPVFLVRAPGRVNILGRHIDHQGGNCNLMAIDREILLAVHPRQDDRVCLYNSEEGRFATRHFAISDLLERLPWDDWMSLVNSSQLMEMVLAADGDWSQYVQAAVLRLQHKFSSLRLRGLDIVVNGNIPIRAGLSSSSALVVASAGATVAANSLEVLPHSSSTCAVRGSGTSAPAAAAPTMPPSSSGSAARWPRCASSPLASSAWSTFRPTTAWSSATRSSRRARRPAPATPSTSALPATGWAPRSSASATISTPLIQHLRDVNTRNLGVPLAWIYRILLSLPEEATRAELRGLLPAETLDPVLATHAESDEGYPIRGVVLFGLAECERSRVGVDLLGSGQVAEFGRLMRVSHDGDRVVRHDAAGTPLAYTAPASNAYLLDQITALETGDPEQVMSAQLQWQPGAYRCSTPDIDWMVDLALGVPGVAGAQLAGAGLGGCMMVLAHREAIPALTLRMTEGYYAPRGLEPSVSVCTPIAGSGVLLKRWHSGQ